MTLQPPEGIVGRLPKPLNLALRDQKKFRRGKDVDLRGKGLDVLLTGQPGMLQNRGFGELIGIPNELQEGGSPRYANGAELGEILRQNMGEGLPYKLDHLVIVLDTSSSMIFDNDQKLNLIKGQIKELGPFIPTGTRVSVIPFNRRASVAVHAETIDNAFDFDEKIMPKIKALKTAGGTNIHEALITASNLIGITKEYDHSNPGRNVIALITDGDHRPGEVSEYNKIFRLAQKISPFRNAQLLIIGVGTDYDTEITQAIAGFSGGMWLHTSKLSAEQNPFSGIIPSKLKQITGNDWFIRCDIKCDIKDVERVWRVGPSVNEIPYCPERIGVEGLEGLHEFRGGYWDKPAAIAVYDKNGYPKYWLAGQFDARIDSNNPDEVKVPEDFGRELDIAELKDLPHELRERAEVLIKRWLLVNIIDKKDLGALYAAHKVGMIDKDTFELLEQGMRGPSSNNPGTEEEARTCGSQISVGVSKISHRSIGPEMEQIEAPSGDLEGSNLLEQLEELGKVKIPTDYKGRRRIIGLPGSIIADQLFRRGDGLTLHSGVLGGLDVPPGESLGEFQGPNVEGYAEAKPIRGVQKSPESIQFTIEYLSGDGDNGPFVLNDDKPLTVGRNIDQDIQIRSQHASRIHCEISLENGEIRITDSGSYNGTYVNEVKIQTAILKPDDTIRIGDAIFKIKL